MATKTPQQGEDPSLPEHIVTLGIYLAIGALGGLGADALGLPMPYLLGSLALVAPIVIWRSATLGRSVRFPRLVRFAFVGIIGMLIGARFSPEIVAKLPTFWISLIAVAVFVLVAHLFGYMVYRRVGGYDRVTALYGSMPGGLIEGVALGERAGGDVVLLTVHHFARIVIVVFAVPLLFFLIAGEQVGSAAGESLAELGSSWIDLAWIAAITGLGLIVGGLLRLPAWHLMGPLFVAALLHAFGVVSIVSPNWLVNVAQLVVGTALATQFAGASPKILARSFGLTLIAVGGMFAAAGVTAAVVTQLTILDYPAAFISFAPGGVAEMGLIALSLDISPVIVAAHHLVRIILTVLFVRVMEARVTR